MAKKKKNSKKSAFKLFKKTKLHPKLKERGILGVSILGFNGNGNHKKKSRRGLV